MKKNSFYIFLLFLLFFLPLLKILSFNKVLAGTDIVSYFFYLFDFFRNSIINKDFPFWNPYLFSGYPYLASVQSGLLYPINYIKVLFNTSLGINIAVIIHFIIGFLGAALLSSFFVKKKVYLIIPALLYCYNGYIATRLFYGHLTIIYVYFWQPFIVYFFLKILLYNSFKDLIAFILIASIVFFAGHPQIYFYMVFSLLCIFLFNIKHLYNRKKIFLKIIFAVIIIIIVILPQFIPTLQFTLNSSRHQDSGYDFNTYFSLHPTHLIQIIAPNYLGNSLDGTYWRSIWRPITGFEEFNIFIGFIALFFIVISFVKVRDKNIIPFKFLFIFSLLVALGKYTFFYRLVYNYIPGFSFFRWPARMMSVFQLSSVILVCTGLSFFFENKFYKKINFKIIWIIFYSVLFISSIIIILHYSLDYFCNLLNIQLPDNARYAFKTMSDTSGFALLKLASIIFLFIVIIKSKYRLYNKIMLISILTFFELISFTGRYFRVQDMSVYENEVHDFLVENTSKTDRVLSISRIEHLTHYTSLGISNIKGYDPMIFDRYANYLQFIEKKSGLSPNIRFYYPDFNHPLFEFLNVKYIVDYDDNISDIDILKSFDGINIYENNNKFGFLKVYKMYKVFSKYDFFDLNFNVLNKYLILDEEPDLISYYFSEKSNIKNYNIIKFSNSNIIFEVENKGDVFLLTSIVDYPGWSVYVNDEKIRHYTGNYLFLTFPLKSGNNMVELVYRPEGFKYYFIISIIVISILIVCIFK